MQINKSQNHLTPVEGKNGVQSNTNPTDTANPNPNPSPTQQQQQSKLGGGVDVDVAQSSSPPPTQVDKMTVDPSTANSGLWETYGVDPTMVLTVGASWAKIQCAPTKSDAKPIKTDDKGAKQEENELESKPTMTTGGEAITKTAVQTEIKQPDSTDAETKQNQSSQSPQSRVVEFYDGFYNNLFTLCPSLRPMFKNSIQVQGKALAGILSVTIKIFADNNLVEARNKLHWLAMTHHHRGVTPDQYAVVGKLLIQTLKEVLKDEFGEQEERAWLHIYITMLKIMSEVEPGLK